MPKGMSIHIGLNRLDPNHYAGWEGILNACEYDAGDMQEIAKELGYKTDLLLSEEATRDALISKTRNASKLLKPGDILLVTYSGHGGQKPDFSEEEEDGLDETWCLYDGQLIDDELHELWKDFAQGVRILVIPDCCHSGTPTKVAITSALMERPLGKIGILGETGTKRIPTRNMPLSIASRVYRKNKAFYDGLEKKLPKKKSDVKASVLSISACQDNQLAEDGVLNGKFTGMLLAVWNDGKFGGNYLKFHKKITEKMPPVQTPNIFYFGPGTDEFLRQRPFEIEPEK
jgi:hypothetical protein